MPRAIFYISINEFDRANLLERQREGIAIAKENGSYKGSNLYSVQTA